MSIVWRDALNVGENMVDGDHKRLVELVNQFEDATSDQVQRKKVAKILLALVEYTKDHFAREEQLLLDIRYPYYQSHVRCHRDLVRQLTDILTRYSVETNDARRDEIVRGIASFLREWLVNHIVQVDLRMKPFVAQAQADKSFRKAAALRNVAAPPDGR